MDGWDKGSCNPHCNDSTALECSQDDAHLSPKELTVASVCSAPIGPSLLPSASGPSRVTHYLTCRRKCMTQTTELVHVGVKTVTVNTVSVVKTEISCQKETENIKTPKQRAWKSTEVAVNMRQPGLGTEHTPQKAWLSKSTWPSSDREREIQDHHVDRGWRSGTKQPSVWIPSRRTE